MLAPPQRTVFIGTKIYRCINLLNYSFDFSYYISINDVYDYYTKLQFYTRTPGCHVQ